MALRQYLFYAAFTATANAAVSIQMVSAGRIKCVSWQVNPVLSANAQQYQIELASVPTLQARTHNSQGTISAIGSCFTVVTSGGGASDGNYTALCNVPVEAGQLLYLNGFLSGTSDVKATCIVTVE